MIPMTTTDLDNTTASGHVVARMTSPDGRSIDVVDRSNTTTYSTADAVASAYAGDLSFIPRKVAFLYGSSGSSQTGINISKGTTWQDVIDEFGSSGIAITEFSYPATISSSDDNHDGNVATFHCRTSGIPDECSVYAACLLGFDRRGNYVLLAIVDLGTDGTYKSKPADFELSIDWAVKFN